MLIAFIILHFKEKSVNDTFECIESIKSIITNYERKIIIVDNGSNDNSSQLLKKKYSQDFNIVILENKENLGFAKGNNTGYEFGKRNYNPDFFIILNNDTIIINEDFIEVIISEFQVSEFHILGPKIITKSLINQNPYGFEVDDLNTVEKSILKTQKIINELNKKFSLYSLILNFKNFLYNFQLLYKFILKLRSIIKHEKKISIDYDSRIENVKLHGSALIFSKHYSNLYDYAFYPKTFLYAEEDILFYIANRDKLKIVYNPKVKIFHKEDVSTNFYINKRDKQKFLLRNGLDSLLVFKKLIEEDSTKRNLL